ncbi:hypothetical protein [Streptomyces candidus]|uniref:Uncharacterized protein n=1 Tax=Streptomyces candidus TaxID=67283 RepID=A0A7X0HLU8_9ACTN|nr:hypothetical protein [Streptomyces candidus]MBB6439931.1 hypothetical protein [Streptomyces candidus]GHH57847.1 hypothetical protein GCM10018773_65770 [Streptomyces candidus]
MPRTAITPTQASRAGTVLPAATAGDAVNGHQVANDGRIALIVKNTGASSRDITFLTTRSVDGLTAPTRVESVPAGETQVFGPFDANDYGTTLAFDVAHAELTINVVRI